LSYVDFGAVSHLFCLRHESGEQPRLTIVLLGPT
jgi:hypothetical protein